MDDENIKEQAGPHPSVATVRDKKKRVPIGFLLLLVTAMLVLGFSVFHSSKPKKAVLMEKLKEINQGQGMDETLQENMARLKQQVANAQARVDEINVQFPEKEGSFTASVDTQSAPSEPALDEKARELQLRRTMPSNMYSEIPLEQPSENKSTTQEATFAGNDPMSQFGNQASQTVAVEAKKMTHPDYTIAEGEVLHGVLETPINSDLPGMVRAVINQPIYAYTLDKPLIPAGARLIGQYASIVKSGQSRAFVVWSRVILPNGINIAINSPGADRLGQAGLAADGIDRHFLERFGNATLLSIIGAGAANAGVSTNDQYNSASAYRQAISQSFQQSANDALQDSSNISNTLIIHQGQQVTVFVAHDLSFYQVLKEEENHE